MPTTVAGVTHVGLEITADLVRDLLRDQHPDLADRPLTLGARGWDNQLWRLGDDLAVRLPWATESADALLRKEGTWLPLLAHGTLGIGLAWAALSIGIAGGTSGS